METRIKNSTHVGSVLLSTLRRVQAEAVGKRVASRVQQCSRPSNRLPIRVAMKRRKLVAHGSGVYEDKSNGDIWYREGEFLVRQKIDVGSIVEQYAKSCQNA